MAYLTIKRVQGYSYYYITKSYRAGGRVRNKTLEYLGRDPDPKRLKKALRYWGVKAIPRDDSGRRTQ